MAITASGIGSGLDINGIVSQLMVIERRPLVQLDQKEAAYQARLSAYGTFKSALTSFQNTMRGLASISRYQGRKASSADSGIFTASAGNGAALGSYAVEVRQLAQAQKLASPGFAATSDTVGTGSLTIQFGTWDGATFTANGERAARTITIDSARATLAGVRDAINEARAGVTASIVNDGSQYKLLISANDTGTANSLKISVSDSGDGDDRDAAGLSRLAYDPAGSAGDGRNLEETVAARNAILKIDGIDNIEKPANVVTDVIDGVTLTLVKASAANTPTTLTVTQDSAAVTTAVEGFVKAYNDLNKTLKDLTAYDPATRKGSVLQGDTAVLAAMAQIRRVIGGSLGATNELATLSQIGVSFQKDGSLALDSARLQAVMATSFNEIAGVFASFGVSSDPNIRFAGATAATQPGRYEVSISQQATRGYRNGASTAALADSLVPGTFDTPLMIDADNDRLSIKVDGTQSGTITLARGSYATGAALAAELQSRINGDAALQAAGARVSVSYDSSGDRLVITSARYGAESRVEIVSVGAGTAATLGLSAGPGTAAGLDVAGTVNGAAGVGDGRFLTATAGTPANGLRLEVDGGSAATVRYSRGFAWQLNQLVGQMLADDGAVDSRIDGLNASIRQLGKRRAEMENRMALTEQRLRAQFVALDGLVAQLRATSDYLSRQLANLPTPGGSGSR